MKIIYKSEKASFGKSNININTTALTMSGSTRIEYSEKYADDAYEYRYVIVVVLSAAAEVMEHFARS